MGVNVKGSMYEGRVQKSQDYWTTVLYGALCLPLRPGVRCKLPSRKLLLLHNDLFKRDKKRKLKRDLLHLSFYIFF
jgi:hypothetical protein